MNFKFTGAACGALFALQACAAAAEVQELKIPKGAGGIGFLPLLVMEQQKLIEKHAAQLGNKNLKVTYANLGGPAVVNDALLSGAAHMAPAGPPAFLFLWDRTRDNAKITGIAAMSSLPMYLNTTNPNIKALHDITDKDKMAVTAIKVSIPSIIMQMAARKEFGDKETFRYDRYTVALTAPRWRGRHAVRHQRNQPALHVAAVSRARTEGSARAHHPRHRRRDGRLHHVHHALHHHQVPRRESGHVQGDRACREGSDRLHQQGQAGCRTGVFRLHRRQGRVR